MGVPCKVKGSFDRFRGYVNYNGTTEFLKALVNQGVRLLKIYSVLHYPSKKTGSELFSESIRLFDSIKQEGIIEGNQGKRSFGKLCNNSSYGLSWSKYSITSHDKSNITIATFIADYAKLELMKHLKRVKKEGGIVYYCDTDSFDTNPLRLPMPLEGNIELSSTELNSEMGGLKYEGSFDKSIYLGKKQYYLLNTRTGKSKIDSKGYDKTMFTFEDWESVAKGSVKLSRTLHFKKEGYSEIRKVYLVKEFKLSLRERVYDKEGRLEALYLKNSPGDRVKASLSNTELDLSSIRVKTCSNSKIPLLKGWLKKDEPLAIKEMLSSNDLLNYSLKTGEVLGGGIHLIVIDIDLKVSTFKRESDKILEEFKEYYTVKTPSGGYHIYVKLTSSEKVKSQHLCTISNEKTTIELLGEKKKVMEN